MAIKFTCGRCGAPASISVDGRDKYTTNEPPEIMRFCPSLKERLAAKGSLTAEDRLCPDMSHAAGAAFLAWQRRNQL